MPNAKLKYSHISFAFTAEDKEILKHCAAESGLTQTELIRRLTRHYAGGGAVVGCLPIRADKRAKLWCRSHAAA